MNFFDAQDRARRATRWLVVVYIVATLLIVAGVTVLVGFALIGMTDTAALGNAQMLPAYGPLLTATAIGAALFIFGASLYKTSLLSAGGGKVATSMGGTLVPADVTDPLRRRLRNVVEEIAIASGVPVPEIYVLEAESGINAFAAGFAPGDAAVAVTRGTLELLNREELQGVIAHEFSHILNGDMRLNIRMMGVLFGIMVLGLIGRMIVRGGYHASVVSRSRDRSAPAVLIIGIGLTVLGGIGVFFARLIKASVSRQREYLADASAVQFTRQTTGIANALKKIGGYKAASYIKATDPEEVSHMLFGTGQRLSGMFATHPPLGQRIRALDPSFSEADYPDVDARLRDTSGSEPDRLGQAAGFAAAFAEGGRAVSPDAIVDSVGNPENRHVEYAEILRQAIPADLYDAAHSKDLSLLLCVALVLDQSGRILPRQLALLDERLGSARTDLTRRFAEQLGKTGKRFRLPLLEVAFPALKSRPTAELSFLLDLTTRLIEIDGHVDLYEYCFHRIMVSNLGQATDPSGNRKARRASEKEVQLAVLNLLGLLADHGHEHAEQRDAAFAAGTRTLGDWASGYAVQPRRAESVAVLDQSLDTLLTLKAKGRQQLLRAIVAVAAYDDNLTTTEAELIRVVCATLDCPLPPILVQRVDG